MTKIKGYDALIKQLKNLENNLESEIKEILRKGANDILKRALEKVPVDSGILRASGDIEELNQGWSFKVYFDAKYAAYQEFGTGGLTEIPQGYEDYAMEFKMGDSRNMAPQPFLFPAFFEFRDAITKEINDLLKKHLR